MVWPIITIPGVVMQALVVIRGGWCGAVITVGFWCARALVAVGGVLARTLVAVARVVMWGARHCSWGSVVGGSSPFIVMGGLVRWW